jgi:hypothetical protein
VVGYDARAALTRRPHRNLTAEHARKPSSSGLDPILDHNLDQNLDLNAMFQSAATKLLDQEYPALLRDRLQNSAII